MVMTDADQLREALRLAVAECDGLTQQLELEREASAQLRRECEERHDELRAEVERLRFVNDCRGDGMTYECNLTRPCVACRLRTVAERQREACAQEARFYVGLGWSGEHVAQQVRSVPLVTEGDK